MKSGGLYDIIRIECYYRTLLSYDKGIKEWEDAAMYEEAHAVISGAALTENFKRLKAMAHGARVIAVVKANAYGHGLAPVTRTLLSAGADFFAVARLSEAIALRGLAPNADILILGTTPVQYANLLSEHHLVQSIHDASYARALSARATQPIRAHLKLDVGMGRFGISLSKPDAFENALRALSEPMLQFEAVFSHLPSADSEEALSDRQGLSFRRFTEGLAACGYPLSRHLLASAGILRYGGGNDGFIRPGLILYGYSPNKSLVAEGFSPVMRLYAPVLAVRELAKGDRLGYGGFFTAPRRMRVAILGIGYGDGLPRALGGACVRLGGALCPIVGRICMDVLFCALNDRLSPKIGELALVFGDRADSLYRLAEHAGTLPYELLTSLSARLCRELSPRKDHP